MTRIEEHLALVRPRAPRAPLRDRVLDAARAEAESSTGIIAVLWRSRLFWAASAAAVVAGLVLPGITERAGAAAVAPKPSAAALEFAATIAPMLGDGADAAYRIALRLSGPPLVPNEDNQPLLEEELQCLQSPDANASSAPSS